MEHKGYDEKYFAAGANKRAMIIGVVIFAIIRNYSNGMNTPADVSNFEIQFAIMVLCFVGYIMAIKHMLRSDGALLDAVKGNLSRVVSTVDKVKDAAGALVEELGANGFMNAGDIEPGMHVELIRNGGKEKLQTQVTDIVQDGILIPADEQIEGFLEGSKLQSYEVHIVVKSALYIWNSVEIKLTDDKNYRILLVGSPKVLNRRKHPRLNMDNPCTIQIADKTISGMMANISAGGYAFICRDATVANCIGDRVEITISDFELMEGKALVAFIIRCTENKGEYIVGCRMPQDNQKILDYVARRVHE